MIPFLRIVKLPVDKKASAIAEDNYKVVPLAVKTGNLALLKNLMEYLNHGQRLAALTASDYDAIILACGSSLKLFKYLASLVPDSVVQSAVAFQRYKAVEIAARNNDLLLFKEVMHNVPKVLIEKAISERDYAVVKAAIENRAPRSNLDLVRYILSLVPDVMSLALSSYPSYMLFAAARLGDLAFFKEVISQYSAEDLKNLLTIRRTRNTILLSAAYGDNKQIFEYVLNEMQKERPAAQIIADHNYEPLAIAAYRNNMLLVNYIQSFIPENLREKAVSLNAVMSAARAGSMPIFTCFMNLLPENSRAQIVSEQGYLVFRAAAFSGNLHLLQFIQSLITSQISDAVKAPYMGMNYGALICACYSGNPIMVEHILNLIPEDKKADALTHSDIFYCIARSPLIGSVILPYLIQEGEDQLAFMKVIHSLQVQDLAKVVCEPPPSAKDMIKALTIAEATMDYLELKKSSSWAYLLESKKSDRWPSIPTDGFSLYAGEVLDTMDRRLRERLDSMWVSLDSPFSSRPLKPQKIIEIIIKNFICIRDGGSLPPLLKTYSAVDTAAKFGLVCQAFPAEGDGFFHAAINQLNILLYGYLSITPQQLRERAVQYIRAHETYFAADIKEDFNKYIKRMARSNKADDVLIKAFALSEAKNVIIFLQSDSGTTLSNPKLITQDSRSLFAVSIFLYISRSHYISVRSINRLHPKLKNPLEVLAEIGINVPEMLINHAEEKASAKETKAENARLVQSSSTTIRQRISLSWSAATTMVGRALGVRGLVSAAAVGNYRDAGAAGVQEVVGHVGVWGSRQVHGYNLVSNAYTEAEVMALSTQVVAPSVGIVGIVAGSVTGSSAMGHNLVLRLSPTGVVLFTIISGASGEAILHASAAMFDASESGNLRLTLMDSAGQSSASLIGALPSLALHSLTSIRSLPFTRHSSCGPNVVNALGEASHVVRHHVPHLPNAPIAPAILVTPAHAVSATQEISPMQASYVAKIVELCLRAGRRIDPNLLRRAFLGDKEAWKQALLFMHPDKNDPVYKASFTEATGIFNIGMHNIDGAPDAVMENQSFMASAHALLGRISLLSRVLTVGSSLGIGILVPTSENIKESATQLLQFGAAFYPVLMPVATAQIAWTSGSTAALSYLGSIGAITFVISSISGISSLTLVITGGFAAYGVMQAYSASSMLASSIFSYIKGGEVKIASEEAYAALGVQMYYACQSLKQSIASVMTFVDTTELQENVEYTIIEPYVGLDGLAVCQDSTYNSTFLIGAY